MSFWRFLSRGRRFDGSIEALRNKLEKFRDLVERNNRVLEYIADAGEKLGGEYVFDIQYLKTLAGDLKDTVRGVVFDLNAMTGNRHAGLFDAQETIQADIQALIDARARVPRTAHVIPLEQIGEELSDVVGDKMARLGEIRRRLGCRVPDGFAVSAYACQRYLESSGLIETASEWFENSDGIGEQGLTERLDGLQTQLLRHDLPRDMARDIRRESARLKRRGPCGSLAIRSSALGEDGEFSFAGQFMTRLGVAPADVIQAYKQVVASLFSPGVVRYRQSCGLDPVRGLMAVGCLCMVPARAGGVLYTLDPSRPERNVLVVSAALGLGKTVVDGTGATDRFELSRLPPHEILARKIATKRERVVIAPDRGTNAEPVPEADRNVPAVTDETLAELSAAALRIEKYMKCALDIEWAVDGDGRVFILQARPLRVVSPASSASGDLTDAVAGHEILLRNQGIVACRGIGSGPVHLVTEESALEGVPENAVLVARTSSPRLAAALAGASAVITDIGTPTGHLAAIAREFRVPAIVDVEIATRALGGAGVVTVDAEENIVYAGRVDALLHDQLLRQSSFEDTYEFRLLRRMLKKIAPLNLKDPQSPTFSPQHCATYHDIIRFAHEKAVQELINIKGMTPSSRSRHVRRLELTIPLDLVIIDLGGGIADGSVSQRVLPEDVVSTPLRALLSGLTEDGIWATGPADMDLEGFMASMTRSAPLTSGPERNLAIISDRYLSLNLRLGYHFNIVDCFLTDTRNDNYIYFRFAGGVTEMTRRSRRATLLKNILEKYDFVVETKGDLVIGRIKKITGEAMIERLKMIGRLIGFTRQLDIRLRDDMLVDRCVTSFLEGKYNMDGG